MSDTTHLNLRWTVGDMDRLELARKNKHRTFRELLTILSEKNLGCTPERLRHIMDAHNVVLRLPRHKRRLVGYIGKERPRGQAEWGGA